MREASPSRTTFIIELPLAEAPSTSGQSSPPDSHLRYLDGRRILLIDDDPQVREVIAELLTLFGGEVCITAQPSQVMAMVDGEHWDLIISDYFLQEMTGLDLTAAIREAHPDTRLVLLTGWIKQSAEARAREIVDMVLIKPLTISDIIKLSDLTSP